jgi:hypothetical protein
MGKFEDIVGKLRGGDLVRGLKDLITELCHKSGIENNQEVDDAFYKALDAFVAEQNGVTDRTSHPYVPDEWLQKALIVDYLAAWQRCVKENTVLEARLTDIERLKAQALFEIDELEKLYDDLTRPSRLDEFSELTEQAQNAQFAVVWEQRRIRILTDLSRLQEHLSSKLGSI